MGNGGLRFARVSLFFCWHSCSFLPRGRSGVRCSSGGFTAPAGSGEPTAGLPMDRSPWWSARGEQSGPWGAPALPSRSGPAPTGRSSPPGAKPRSNTCSPPGPRGVPESTWVGDWPGCWEEGRAATCWPTWAWNGVLGYRGGGPSRQVSGADSGCASPTTGGNSPGDGGHNNEIASGARRPRNHS